MDEPDGYIIPSEGTFGGISESGNLRLSPDMKTPDLLQQRLPGEDACSKHQEHQTQECQTRRKQLSPKQKVKTKNITKFLREIAGITISVTEDVETDSCSMDNSSMPQKESGQIKIPVETKIANVNEEKSKSSKSKKKIEELFGNMASISMGVTAADMPRKLDIPSGVTTKRRHSCGEIIFPPETPKHEKSALQEPANMGLMMTETIPQKSKIKMKKDEKSKPVSQKPNMKNVLGAMTTMHFRFTDALREEKENHPAPDTIFNNQIAALETSSKLQIPDAVRTKRRHSISELFSARKSKNETPNVSEAGKRCTAMMAGDKSKMKSKSDSQKSNMKNILQSMATMHQGLTSALTEEKRANSDDLKVTEI